MLYRLPQQVFVDAAENFFRQLQRANFFAAQVDHINLCHKNLCRRIAYFFLPAAAFLAAFNGSIVVAPAKPRRSRGGFLALLIST